jgi:phage terminase small subunit
VNEIPNSTSATQAAIEAGYSPNSARFIASENLTKSNIQREIVRILDQSDLSDDKLASRLRKAIDSGIGKKSTNADALRGIEMSYKLRDRFPADKRLEARIDLKAELSKRSMKELRGELVRIRAEEEKYLQD